jgi:formate-dependent nitrite reductase membrane component NrfD
MKTHMWVEVATVLVVNLVKFEIRHNRLNTKSISSWLLLLPVLIGLLYINFALMRLWTGLHNWTDFLLTGVTVDSIATTGIVWFWKHTNTY